MGEKMKLQELLRKDYMTGRKQDCKDSQGRFTSEYVNFLEANLLSMLDENCRFQLVSEELKKRNKTMQ